MKRPAERAGPAPQGEAFRRRQAGERRRVGQGAVTSAVRRLSCWVAAEAKIKVLRIADRKVAVPWPKREDSEGGCRGVRRGRLLRCWRDGSKRRRFGAAICPGRNRGGGFFNLGHCYRLRDQETEQNVDGVGDAARAGSPPPDVPRTDVKQLTGVNLRETERAE
jgi:hypothetical protein